MENKIWIEDTVGPKIHQVYKAKDFKAPAEDTKPRAPRVVDLNKSYESMNSNDKEGVHYNYDSDGEPPTDIVGDKLTIIKKQQVVKTILEVGESGLGKPGRPYIVKVSFLGYFAPDVERSGAPAEENKTKSVDDYHIRLPADIIKGRGEVFVDHSVTPIQLTLGDDRLPYGLWKAIEHMRKGEKSQIMIKPKWSYNCEQNREVVFFPRGWAEGEKKQQLMTRRVFFEVKLHDWVVRHDINGDGLLVKTIVQKGEGMDRVGYHDEITLDLKIYQRDIVFCELKDLATSLSNKKDIPKTIAAILESMKKNEKVECLVQPAFFLHFDKDLQLLYPGIDEDKILQVDLNLKELQPITDLYKDGTTFFKALERQQKPEPGNFKPGMTYSTASPFHDSIVKLMLTLQVDDEIIFDGGPVEYDMEGYQMPAVLRRILKQSKLQEKIQIKSNLSYKLLDHLDDEVFKIEKMKSFSKNIIITFKLLEIKQKDHVLKVPMAERLQKLQDLQTVQQKFIDRPSVLESEYYKRNDDKKAVKLCARITRNYKKKGDKNQFVEEDENTLEYRDLDDKIEELHILNYQNHARLLSKQNNFTEAMIKIQMCLDKLDHKNYKSLLVKIEILQNQGKFKQIKEILNDLKEFHPERVDEILVLEQVLVEKFNAQLVREREVYSKMFGGGNNNSEAKQE